MSLLLNTISVPKLDQDEDIFIYFLLYLHIKRLNTKTWYEEIS